MQIYNGDIKDTSNLESNSYLQINVCGSISATDTEYLVVRSGRCDYHILYVLDGEIEVFDKDETAIRLSRGDFVLYPPRTPQKYKRCKGAKDCWIHFNGFQVAEILNDASVLFGINRSGRFEEIKATFFSLITEYNARKKDGGTVEKGILLTLLYMLGNSSPQKSYSRQRSLIEKAILYLNENYTESFSNEFLASLCNLSLGRFEHLFKSEMGISPNNYKQNLRVENAKSLLLSTRLSISEIGSMCGFSDSLYFSRVFKKRVGVSPLEYRRIQGEF